MYAVLVVYALLILGSIGFIVLVHHGEVLTLLAAVVRLLTLDDSCVLTRLSDVRTLRAALVCSHTIGEGQRVVRSEFQNICSVSYYHILDIRRTDVRRYATKYLYGNLHVVSSQQVDVLQHHDGYRALTGEVIAAGEGYYILTRLLHRDRLSGVGVVVG